MIRRPLLEVVLVSLFAPAALGQTTWVVDDNGTGDFVHIQGAVNAAQDGDVISVLDGAYAGFTVNGKSLVLAGALGADVRVAAPVTVRNVASGKKVELDNLRIGVTFADVVPTLTIENNPGSIRIVDCEIVGQYNEDAYYEKGTVRCQASMDVGVLRSTLTGFEAGFESFYYHAGLYAHSSNVVVTSSLLIGGEGAPYCGGGFGGPAVHLAQSSTLASFDTTFTGGPGGVNIGGFGCGTQANGPQGFAVRTEAGSSLEWKSSTFEGNPTFGAFTGPGTVATTEIAAYCFGTWEECPCGNNGAATAGCETAYDSGGARLTATGTSSVGGDTLTLVATGLRPDATPTGLFFQGTAMLGGGMGAPFNDGLLCATGTIRRLKGRLASGGSVSFGFDVPGDMPVSTRGQIPPAGGTYTYQLWFRHAAPQYCTTARFHMSNALEITWLP